ncbi:hypothetical protein QQP08_010971 [Theobroma cacao]|nr:hypothetical protein QQP08_010971 [Theobroma cacao]
MNSAMLHQILEQLLFQAKTHGASFHVTLHAQDRRHAFEKNLHQTSEQMEYPHSPLVPWSC